MKYRRQYILHWSLDKPFVYMIELDYPDSDYGDDDAGDDDDSGGGFINWIKRSATGLFKKLCANTVISIP